MPDMLAFLQNNEPTISAIVGLMTLIAAAWGFIQLALLPLVRSLRFSSGEEREVADTSLRLNLFSTLLDNGLNPISELDEQIAVRTLNLCLLIVVVFALGWLVVTLSSPETVILTIVNFSVFLIAVVAYNFQTAGAHTMARWLFLIDIAFYWVTTIVVMGPMNGLEYFLAALLILPLILFRREEKRQQFTAVVLMVAALILALYLQGVLPIEVDTSQNFVIFGYYVNAVFLGVIVCISLNFYSNSAANSFLELEDQKLKSDALVRSILPDYIAEKLANHETTVADWHKEATVLFATVYGFETLYQRVSAVQLVELLSQVFVEFDHIVTARGVDKVNTLGTNYVAATGIDASEEADHVGVAEVALEMEEVVRLLSETVDHHFSLRIGICTGPVVSGVIGEARPSFDIWGQTVELAHSMRDAAMDNTIVVNDAANWRLRSHFDLQVLGGEPPRYLLEQRKLSSV